MWWSSSECLRDCHELFMTERGHWEVLGDHVCSIWRFYLILTLSLHFLFDSHHNGALRSAPAICVLGAWPLLKLRLLREKDVFNRLSTRNIDPACPEDPNRSLVIFLPLSTFKQVKRAFVYYRLWHLPLRKARVLLVWVFWTNLTMRKVYGSCGCIRIIEGGFREVPGIALSKLWIRPGFLGTPVGL